MMAPTADAHTKASQRRASDPSASAWVSANAGSGKTTVLRNRVLRLLLAGVDPGRILCLTFTRAAATEMSIRVFKELANWVGLDDGALRAVIADMSGAVPTTAMLDEARRLFARAIETPGGLRIDTIHGFCTRLLQAFSIEANVPARFTVLEDQERRELLARAQADMLTRALSGEDRDLFDALAQVGEHVSHAGFGDIVEAALGMRPWAREAALKPGFAARQRIALSEALRIEAGLTTGDVEDGILARAASDFCRRVLDALGKGTPTEKERREEFLAVSRREDRLRLYQGLFLIKSGEPRKTMLAKAAAAYDPSLPNLMNEEAARLADDLDRIAAVETRERTLALLALVQAIRRRFAKLKSDSAALDFDDLIGATRRLLHRASAAFVLYKLDATIEHLLVDEAQDTNRDYWAILRALTAEFTAGTGARGGRLRTVFAVGDEKQSIFGFQGAEPATFGETRAAFAKDYRALESEAGQPLFHGVTLNVSFRSTREVLAAVDAIFAIKEYSAGLTFDGGKPPPHETTRGPEPGAVDLWPVEEGDAARAADPFHPPGPDAPIATAEAKLARRIAAQIQDWTGDGCDLGRRVQPGDILILVRRRARMFQTVIRALKRAGVPVAGADRLSLSEHIAVDDLVAAGRAALLPEDDLTVACVLKSPFVGLDDDDLLRIAPKRAGSLREALRDAAGADPRFAAADARLDAMRHSALNEGAFAFYARLLGPGGGRLALMGRLGPEAAEASDEVLRLALGFERNGGASLADFLRGLQAAGADIKRDLSVPRGEVRVMTVHGSKGLEAPIVILADACSLVGRPPPLLMMPASHGNELPVWVPRAELHCRATLAARAADDDKRAREDRRLLYVAMTRARDRLIVAGCRPRRSQDLASSWYGMAERALSQAPPGLQDIPGVTGDIPIRRWRFPSPAEPARHDEPARPATVTLPEPAWLRRTVLPEPPVKPPLRPSSAVEAAEEPRRDGSTDRAALLAGRLAHKLLEFLPQAAPGERAAWAERIADREGAGLPPARRRDIVEKAVRLIDDPAMGMLFSPEGLAEVGIAGSVTLADGADQDVSGRIDRLVVTPDNVLIADFKSGTLAGPGARQRAMGQLAAYRALARKVYPGRGVRCFLVMLDGPEMIEPSTAELDLAFSGITS